MGWNRRCGAQHGPCSHRCRQSPAWSRSVTGPVTRPAFRAYVQRPPNGLAASGNAVDLCPETASSLAGIARKEACVRQKTERNRDPDMTETTDRALSRRFRVLPEQWERFENAARGTGRTHGQRARDRRRPGGTRQARMAPHRGGDPPPALLDVHRAGDRPGHGEGRASRRDRGDQSHHLPSGAGIAVAETDESTARRGHAQA